VWIKPSARPAGCTCDGCGMADAEGGGFAFVRGRSRQRSIHIVTGAEAISGTFNVSNKDYETRQIRRCI